MSPGDDMDRLLEKHAEMGRSSNAYAIALRHAAETRALVSSLGMMPNAQVRRCRRQGGVPGQPKTGRKAPKPGQGVGQKAYEWAAANKATAAEAVRKFGCTLAVIHAHRSRYNLPHLPR